MSTKLVGPLYQRQNPAQSGGVAVVIGTRVVSPFVRRKRARAAVVPAASLTPQIANATGESGEVLGTIPHANAPNPAPIPTPKSAIGAPKPRPPTAKELLATLGPERETTAGVVVRK